MIRTVLSSAIWLALGVAAVGAELPVEGQYGTPTGCAIANRMNTVPNGDYVTFGPEAAVLEGNRCIYTEIVEGEDAVANQEAESSTSGTWQVDMNCAMGHEGSMSSTLSISQSDDAETLTVELLDGEGPEGEFDQCPNPEDE